MTEFNAQAIADVQAAAEAAVAEIGEAFSRAFDHPIEVQIAGAAAADPTTDLDVFGQPGLAIVLNVEDQAALVAISLDSGLLPDWYENPDPTGESKLATLGQELGMTLLPESLMSLEFRVRQVEDLAAACRRGELGQEPAKLNLSLVSDGNSHQVTMFWPLTKPEAVFEESAPTNPQPVSPAEEATRPPMEPTRAAVAPSTTEQRIQDFGELPSYCRSLLHIEVPIRVILASKQMKVHDIVGLGIGTIIQFDKSCEDTLDVEIGSQRIAEGEAVKIGEKFGIRVTSITMPEERYISLKARRRVR